MSSGSNANPTSDLTESAGALRAGLALSGMTVDNLWLAYVSLGGTMTSPQLAHSLQAPGNESKYEHDLLAHAVNEYFLDHGLAGPVPYADELGASVDKPRVETEGPPLLSPSSATPFEQASSAMLDYLQWAVPMGFWAVTSCDGGRQRYLAVRDGAYGLGVGDSHAWSDSLCQHMVTGKTPEIAPDVTAIPQYREAGVRATRTIGAYVGVPIRRADGSLFGTLCGLDPTAQKAELRGQQPLLDLLVMLLGNTLPTEHG